MEFAFNLVAALAFWCMRRQRVLAGQHFHCYLIAYGSFRFLHEFLRDTPKVFAGMSGYQITALLLVALGVIGFARRSAHARMQIPLPPETITAECS